MKEYRQKQIVQAQQLEYHHDGEKAGRVKDWGTLRALAPADIQKRNELVFIVVARGRITMREEQWLVRYPGKPGDRPYHEVYENRAFKDLFEDV